MQSERGLAEYEAVLERIPHLHKRLSVRGQRVQSHDEDHCHWDFRVEKEQPQGEGEPLTETLRVRCVQQRESSQDTLKP